MKIAALPLIGLLTLGTLSEKGGVSTLAEQTEGGVRAIVMKNADEIQKIIDATPEGGRIEIPSGQWLVRNTLIPKNGHQIIGIGRPLLQLDDNINKPVIFIDQDGVRVSGLEIDGNRPQQTQEQSTLHTHRWTCNNGISIDSCDGTTLDNLKIRNCKSAGICTERGAKNIRVIDVETSGNEFDGLAGCDTSKFFAENLHSWGNEGAAVSLDHQCRDYVVRKSILVKNKDKSIYARAVKGGLLFEECDIQGDIEVSQNHGIAGDDGKSTGVKFRKNKFIGKADIRDGSEVLFDPPLQPSLLAEKSTN